MAASLRIKVYTQSNVYVAACRHPEEAACLAAMLGDGATLRDGHAKRDTFWTEGPATRAGDSYDRVADALQTHRDQVAAKLVAKAAASSTRVLETVAERMHEKAQEKKLREVVEHVREQLADGSSLDGALEHSAALYELDLDAVRHEWSLHNGS